MTVERAGEGAGERVQGVVGDGRWSRGGCGGSSVAVGQGRVRWVVGGGGAGEGAGGRLQSRNTIECP